MLNFQITGTLILRHQQEFELLFKNNQNINYKFISCIALAVILLLSVLLFTINSINVASTTNENIFSYTIKIRDAVEEIDKIFERAELNVNGLVDSISNSYDINKQQDKAYNMQYIKSIDSLIESVLPNSPGVDGDWFQLNADLPFSAEAYNWYEFRDEQFINVKDSFEGTPSMTRKITPEDDPYYYNALNSANPVWSDLYTDSDTKDSMMTVSAPIYKAGALVGVVGIDISTNNLQQALQNMQLIIGDSELYLLDKNNKVILSQLDNGPSTTKSNYPFLKLFTANQEGPIEYYENLTKKTAIMLTLSNKYKVVIAIENKTLFGELNNISKALYLLFILLLLSTTLIFINQYRLNSTNAIIQNKPTEEKQENESETEEE